ncbi:phosphotransferase family protein [Actinomadura nitritigenes]|uniref:Phosphotransferase family protein n=1 Tax=Actinomadura nitritigenes TaxID=134602 RepID=A0ABS3R072_9ACTN|nr:phosphotransferase [Actinomadura nitritigenes]MBO2439412.1 phosphotransferase family protein [Actinomadura nitritigenes]
MPVERLVRQPGRPHDVGHARTRRRAAPLHDLERGVQQAAHLAGVPGAPFGQGTPGDAARHVVRSTGNRNLTHRNPAGVRRGPGHRLSAGSPSCTRRRRWRSHERQVERWTTFLNRIKGRDLPGFDVAAVWLRAHRPLDYVPGIMHGDYQFANVMYRDGAPARLAALVDWEMGTIGDPKLDLGWMLQSWPEDTGAPEAAEASYVDLRGMPSREQMLGHYAEVSGRQVDDIDYYLVLAKWKLGVVLEQGYQRAGDDAKLLAFGPIVLDLMAGAADLAESSGYTA